MKKLKMLAVISLITLFGCSKDENLNYLPNESHVNEWTLIESTGTIAGIKHEFPNGKVVWKFNSNNTDGNLQSGFASGTYNYAVNNNPLTASCQQNITINLEEFGCIAIYDNQMDIVQNISDGINYHFEKVMPFTTN